ncbi:class I SAM-dependent methyltransferase [Alkaliphilus transvaalensis]|uniref:class I SAM-dependent methyltransferase n=1 Tax=Alkaliphilus transvaalensis TaxID=114628 RepID=UPI00047D6417|nr:methyltransferase domain-containing protein [Alkaliphilus transvaalensis]
MLFTERAKWNRKFKERGDELMAPESFIVENIDLLQKGTVLDLACGDGRNSVYLAKVGFSVTGVDFSEEGLNRLEIFASNNNLTISQKLIDLSNHKAVSELGRYNNIIVNHFKPSDDILILLPNLLKREGILLINTFNYRQSEENGFPRRFCLEENELMEKFEDLKLLKHEVYQDERGFLDGYIFQRL